MKLEKIGFLFLLTVYLIFVICAAILLSGLVGMIFYGWTLPQFYFLIFATVISEPIALFLLWTKNILGLRSGVKIRKYATDEEINEYMKRLISSGSTLDIVSGRLHWVSEDQTVKRTIIERAKGADINIYLPAENQIARELKEKGLHVHIDPSLGEPHARFTLVDKGRPGSAMLAVGYGRIPDFNISEFYEANSPQVVALARDYIKKLGE